MTLGPWAKAQAERLMAPLGDRWLHVQAVARQAGRVVAVLSAEGGELLVTAALLHAGRVRLSNGKIIRSRPNRSLPPVGRVAGHGSAE